jgi:hypothetical protein
MGRQTRIVSLLFFFFFLSTSSSTLSFPKKIDHSAVDTKSNRSAFTSFQDINKITQRHSWLNQVVSHFLHKTSLISIVGFIKVQFQQKNKEQNKTKSKVLNQANKQE